MKCSGGNAKIENAPKNEKTGRPEFGHFLYYLAAVALFMLIASQVFLAVPVEKPAFFSGAGEGELLGGEAYLYTPCTIVLQLVGENRCPELKVLVNGVEEYSFDDKEIVLGLKDGDVVELDAGMMLLPATVRVCAASSNVAHLLGGTISASRGIVPLAVVNCDG